ncbi:olfactory receptor 5B12-like [Gastrophryne carolinensis]
MVNQTSLRVLLLSGLSDLPSLQLPLFLFFLLIYLLTLTWNLLIVSLIFTASHLHTPMYFFLGNLASLDLCHSSVTVPRMLFDLNTQKRAITTLSCITQVFFFLFFAVSEAFLLAIMSYDRYVAICSPLHYLQLMHWKLCLQLASSSWFLGFTYSFIQTFYASKLTFCGSQTIESFFCDLPQLFQISCSDVFINILLIFLLGGLISIGSLIIILLSYVYIFQVVLKMQIPGNRSKVFSTCSSHLTVVFIYYGTFMINYFHPGSSNLSSGNKLVSVFYTAISPLLNPLIYSLRNQDFRRAFLDVLRTCTIHLASFCISKV